MTGTLSSVASFRYDIIQKYSKKSIKEKNDAINELIDEIIKGKLPPSEIKYKKKEAKIIAEMLLR